MVGSSRQPASRLRSAAYSVLHSAMVAGILRQGNREEQRRVVNLQTKSTEVANHAAY